jgi:hypothetical protein
MYLPIQLIIFRLSPPRFTLTEGLSFTRFLDQLTLINFYPFSVLYDPMAYLCVILLAAYAGISLIKHLQFDRTTAFLSFVSTLFPLTLIPFFNSHIYCPLFYYYLISLLPLLFLLFAKLWGEISIKISSKIQIPVLLLLFSVAASSYDFKDRRHPLKSERQDIKSAYDLILKDKKENDLVLTLCLNPTSYCPEWLMARVFYFKDSPRNFSDPLSVARFEKALKEKTPVQNIYFVFNKKWSVTDIGESFQIGTFEGVSVYKLPVERDAATAVVHFIEPLITPSLNSGVIFPETLAYLVASYNHLGDQTMKSKFLGIYKSRAPNIKNNLYLDRIDSAQ